MDKTIDRKKWTLKRLLVVVVTSIIIILFVLYFLLRDNRLQMDVMREQVQVYKVATREFMDYLPVEGIVYPRNSIKIDAVEGGIVQEIFVEDGQELKKGQLILKLQNSNMELQFMEQETRIYDAINNLQNTQINLERNKYSRRKEIVELEFSIDKLKTDFNRKKILFDKKVIALEDYEDVERDFKESRLQLELSLKLTRIDSISYEQRKQNIQNSIERMYTNLELLRKNFDNLYVKAPETGILSSFQLELGETIQSGEHFGQLDMAGGVLIKANIDERYSTRVFKGQMAVLDHDGKNIELKVEKIYSTIDAGSFQFDMIFSSNESIFFKRGKTLQLRLLFSNPEETIVVKKGSFFQETGGNWIYVLSSDGKCAVKRNIQIGRQNALYYEIIDGLKSNESVIISSYDRFKNIDKLNFN